jgi:CDP-diacylglycerol--glycerol-3-phosphate 3-phosphatidyltransferase
MSVEVLNVLDNANARRSVARFIDPVARFLLRLKITPDAITWFGCLATVAVSAAFLARGDFLIGAILYGAFSLIDLVDGTMARMLGSTGSWGAFLDSTLDRVSDSAVLCALIYYYVTSDGEHKVLIVSAAIVSLVMSLMTSYIRAKAESLDAECKVGIAERAERNIILWVALLISGIFLDVMLYALILLALLTTITVIQRLLFVRNQLVLKS